ARVADGVEVGLDDVADALADERHAAGEFSGSRAALLVDELLDMLGGPRNVSDRLQVRALLGLGVGEEIGDLLDLGVEVAAELALAGGDDLLARLEDSERGDAL